MSTERLTALILGTLLVLGMIWIGSTVILGTLLFAGIWALAKRIPGMVWTIRHAPLVADVVITVGTFLSLSLLGVASTTLYMATAVSGVEASLAVALMRDRYLRQKEGVTQSQATGASVGEGPHTVS